MIIVYETHKRLKRKLSLGLTVLDLLTSITCQLGCPGGEMVSNREMQVQILLRTQNFSLISERCVESHFVIYLHLPHSCSSRLEKINFCLIY